MHDLDALGVDRGIGAQDVASHARADGDHGIRRLERGLLDPAGHPVAPAELLGLPRTQRLQTVRRHDVRDAMEQLGEVAGPVRVPGVAVHDVGAGDVLGHLQVDTEGRQGRIGGGELRGHQVRVHMRFIARLAERPHHDIRRWTQRVDQLGHVDTGSAVDLRRIFAAQNVDSHSATLAQRGLWHSPLGQA